MISDNIAVSPVDPLWLAGVSLLALRHPNTIVGLGDSRVQQIHADGAYRNKTAYNHFSMGNALAGQRAILVKNLGKSADRTDQVLARLGEAIASGAKYLYIHCGCNDIGNNYPTATTSGITAWTNIQKMIDAAIRNGMTPILVLEPGAQNFNATQLAQLATLQQKSRQYAEQVPMILFDLPAAILDPAATNTGQLAFIGLTDGTHEGNLAGYNGGKAWAQLLTSIMPPRPFGARSPVEQPGISLISLLNNPTMTAAGGAPGTGNSGTVAGSWNGQRSGTSSGAFSVNTLADGTKEQVIACTFAAAGEEVRIVQDVAIGNWSPGDILNASAEVIVDAGSVNLAGVTLYVQANGKIGATDTPVTAMDGYCTGTGATTKEGYALSLRTENLPVPAYTTKSWVTVHVKAVASGAGSATIRIRRAQAHKRSA